MRTIYRRIVLVMVLTALAVLAVACGLPALIQSPSAWTPPATGATEVAVLEATATETAVPATSTPVPTREATATFTPTTQPAAAATTPPTPKPSPTLIPSPTVDQHLIVITEQDIATALTGGAAAEQGLKADNLKVRFADGKVQVTADSLSYGAINVRNLNLVGQLVARNGKLELVTESVSPGGLIGALIPSVASQALSGFASNWYVEQVNTLPGRIELRIR
jgi:hypothetical protein